MEDLASLRSRKSSPEVRSDSDSISRKDERLLRFRGRVVTAATGGVVLVGVVRSASEDGLRDEAASICCAALLFSVTVSSLLLLSPLPPVAADRAEFLLTRIWMFEWWRRGAGDRPKPEDAETGLDDEVLNNPEVVGSEEVEATFLDAAVGRIVAASDVLDCDSAGCAFAIGGRADRERGGTGRLPAILAWRGGTARPPKLPFTREGMTDGVSVVDGRLKGFPGGLVDGPSSPRPSDDVGELVVDIGSTGAEGAASKDGRNETRLEDATVADLVRCSVESSF
jgi:hypothetical protein